MVGRGALGGFGGSVDMGAEGGRGGAGYVGGVYGRIAGVSLTVEPVLAPRVLRVREVDVEPLGLGADDVAHL